jgi:hypothetical protein
MEDSSRRTCLTWRRSLAASLSVRPPGSDSLGNNRGHEAVNTHALILGLNRQF